ncbi:MAG: hypothetical protein ABEJ86_00325 [Halococcoides sp.]
MTVDCSIGALAVVGVFGEGGRTVRPGQYDVAIRKKIGTVTVE